MFLCLPPTQHVEECSSTGRCLPKVTQWVSGVPSTFTGFGQVLFTVSGYLTWAKRESWQDTLVFKVESLQPGWHQAAEHKKKAKLGGKLEAIKVADHDLLKVIFQTSPFTLEKTLCSYNEQKGPTCSATVTPLIHGYYSSLYHLAPATPPPTSIHPPPPTHTPQTPSLHNPSRYPSHWCFHKCCPQSWVTLQLCASGSSPLLFP